MYLESLLTQDPLILQAMVVGDARSYLAALIVPNPDALRAEVVRRGLAVPPNATALAHADVVAIFRERIDQQLAAVAPYEQVRKFTLLPRGFSIEAGELTPKLSLRRQQIQANFAARLRPCTARRWALLRKPAVAPAADGRKIVTTVKIGTVSRAGGRFRG